MDNVELYTLWRETRSNVSALHRACERGERVTEAIHFARYLQWSGILRELKSHRTEGNLAIDGALAEWETSELLQLALSIPETKRLGSFEERVMKNLDMIAGQVQRVAPPVPVTATASTTGGAL